MVVCSCTLGTPQPGHGMDDERDEGGAAVRHCAPTSTEDYMLENKMKL